MSTALNKMEDSLKKYYGKTDFPPVYADAMILNSRCKFAIFEEDTWSHQDVNKYSRACRQRFETHYVTQGNLTPSAVSNENGKRTADIHEDAEFVEFLHKRSIKRRRNDYDRYVNIPNDSQIPSSLQ